MPAIEPMPFVWAHHMSRIIGGIGSDSLAPRVLAALATLVEFEHTGIFLFSPAMRPRDVLARHLHDPFHRKYFGGTYKLDPFYQCSHAHGAVGVFRMGDLDAGYARYLQDYEMGPRLADIVGPAVASGHIHAAPATANGSRLREEIGYLLPIDRGRVVHIALIRSVALASFRDEEMDQLRRIAPVLQAIFEHHFRDVDLPPDDDAGDGSGNNDGVPTVPISTLVTSRELEVIEGVASGLTSSEIARRLGIATETVKVHRKNAYRKLLVSTQSELRTLLRRGRSPVMGG